MGAGQFHADAGAAKPLDRLAVEAVGLLAFAQQRPRARLDAQRPVGAGGAGPFCELAQGVRRDVGTVASDARLDQLSERPAVQTEIIVGTRALGGGKSFPIAAKAVVQHRGHVLGKTDRSSQAPSCRVFDARLDHI